MGKKATTSPCKSPLKNTQLRLSRILTKETKKPQIHTCSYSHRLKSQQPLTLISEGPQRCRCSCEKGITPGLSLGSHRGLNTSFCTEKNNWWGRALAAHTLTCACATVSTGLKTAQNSETAASSCLRFTQKEVSSSVKKYLNLPKTLAFASSSAKCQQHKWLGLAFAGDVRDGSRNQELLLFFRKAHSEVPTHTTPGTSSTLLNHLVGTLTVPSAGYFFPGVHPLVLVKVMKPSCTFKRGMAITSAKRSHWTLQQTEQPVTKVGCSWIWERRSAVIGK